MSVSEKLVRFASWLWKETTRLIDCMQLGKEEGRQEGGGEEEKSLGMTAVHTILGQNSEDSYCSLSFTCSFVDWPSRFSAMMPEMP